MDHFPSGRLVYFLSGARSRASSSAKRTVSAPAESVIGLFKTEVFRRKARWRSLDAAEFATLAWVDWFNTRWLPGPIADIRRPEFEAQYYAQAHVP